MSTLTLIDHWRLDRKQSGLDTVIRPFHHTIANNLTRLMLGLLPKPNLMILMPPRCGKTDLGVRGFIPYALSHFPDSEFIVTSYASDLAEDNSVACRNSLSADWYRQIIRSDYGARVMMTGDKAGGRKDHFLTEQGGTVKAVGVGGGITGFGAGKLRDAFGGAIVIDDPLKAQDRNSAAARKNCVDWYVGTLSSRKNRRNTPVVLIMQRLHPQDLAGYALQEERDQWNVIDIPAQNADGTSIWEQRIGKEELDRMKEANPEIYWAQYQQQPSESAFTIFKSTWWRYWNDLDRVEDRITLKFITADTAFKAKDSNDWTVFQCWGIEGISGMYLIDQWRGRWEFPTMLKKATEFWKKHSKPENPRHTPATEFWIEDKASGTSLAQTLRSEDIPARDWEPPDKISPDKVGRANQCTQFISQGRIFLPLNTMPGYQWVDGFVNEHSAFTSDDSHLFDDQVDAETEAILIWRSRGGGKGIIPVWLH